MTHSTAPLWRVQPTKVRPRSDKLSGREQNREDAARIIGIDLDEEALVFVVLTGVAHVVHAGLEIDDRALEVAGISRLQHGIDVCLLRPRLEG